MGDDINEYLPYLFIRYLDGLVQSCCCTSEYFIVKMKNVYVMHRSTDSFKLKFKLKNNIMVVVVGGGRGGGGGGGGGATTTTTTTHTHTPHTHIYTLHNTQGGAPKDYINIYIHNSVNISNFTILWEQRELEILLGLWAPCLIHLILIHHNREARRIFVLKAYFVSRS